MPVKRKQFLKVIILGESGVGKTSLMNRYVRNEFSMRYKATIGADFMTKETTIEDKPITLQIWDTAGQERFQSLGTAFYRGADCCMLVYDVTNEHSFERLDTWKREFLTQADLRNPETFPFLLVGNKTDGLGDVPSTISQSQIEEWCSSSIPYIETSAKDGTNVEDAFQSLALRGLKRILEREAESLNYHNTAIRLTSHETQSSSSSNIPACTC